MLGLSRGHPSVRGECKPVTRFLVTLDSSEDTSAYCDCTRDSDSCPLNASPGSEVAPPPRKLPPHDTGPSVHFHRDKIEKGLGILIVTRRPRTVNDL